MPTTYHAKYFAHELTKRSPSGDIDKFAAALLDSRVDLNPHQVEAALFAFRSPLSHGAILADEVGLGKTIEAGIVLSQKWAEGRRKILIILPSSLRKQWHQELMDKFYLPSAVLESTVFNREIKQGASNPFDRDEIVLCSYPFARNKAAFVSDIPWDLVVIDEAHRLRNVYKPQNKIANAIRDAIKSAPKLLLTATPLQNSLLELFGLVSFIDEHTFGDLRSFKSQFARLDPGEGFDDLKSRLNLVCKRTLRRQVLEYIRYTSRKCHTQEFTPSRDEQRLYDNVSEYLQRDSLHALPSSQRTLMTLVLRKLLASSTFAIAGALNSLANKLQKQVDEAEQGIAEAMSSSDSTDSYQSIQNDFEAYTQISDELLDDEEEDEDDRLTPEQIAAIKHEIVEVREFYERAVSITENAKGMALLTGLNVGFRMTAELGGPEKAIIFTESRRTQDYLVDLLSRNGYEGDIVLFNGSNNDQKSKDIYAAWKEKHAGTDKMTGTRAADIRAALVDHFRNEAKIMIATEAASEGINLQFCSMVVNYDLPWNPQRIEQRIGRCHRYGQKFDVVVVNFLNRDNAADRRVYELLEEKFQLFDGVFGASDEVLGTIESGVDFERRIADIYQTCRSPKQIQLQFDFLQDEMSEKISANMQDARTKLLENFDTEVAEKLNVYKEKSVESVNRLEVLLWDTTRIMLDGKASFDETQLTFDLPHGIRLQLATQDADESRDYPTGTYSLKPRDDVDHHYRLHHPLAQAILAQASNQILPPAHLEFDYSNTPRNISILEPLIGQSGILTARRVSISSLEKEDHVLVSGITDGGEALTEDQSKRLMTNLPAIVKDDPVSFADEVQAVHEKTRQALLEQVLARNAQFFDEETDKLERWSSDLKRGLESELKELNKQINEAKKARGLASGLEEKLEREKEVKQLEATRKEKRKKLYDAEDAIDERRDGLIAETESKLAITQHESELFTIRWSIV